MKKIKALARKLKFKVGLMLLTVAFALISGCSTMGKMSDVKPAKTECSRIVNIDELIRGYSSTEKQRFNLEFGYMGYTVGTSRDDNSKFFATQDRLNQQTSTIRNLINAVIIMQNHSCSELNTASSWQTMNTLIQTLAEVYKEPISKQDMNGRRREEVKVIDDRSVIDEVMDDAADVVIDAVKDIILD